MVTIFKDFFSTSNKINENTVMGVVFAIALIVSTFVDISPEKYYTLAALTASFFGLGALKR